MISTAKQKSGSSGANICYMLGGRLDKDQQVRVVSYEGFALSRLKIAEIENIPSTEEEKTAHKKAIWQIANNLSRIFDARTALADYRVNNPLEDYVVSFVNEERERLQRAPTKEERKQYGLPKLKDGEADERLLERIILEEFLAEIGVHGEIEKKLRRKGKDGKKYTVKQNVQRDAMFLAVAHDGTAHPHLHVLTARPDANGMVNDTRNERRRILSTLKKLSKKYNLSMKLEGHEVDLEKTNEGYAAKIQARDNVLWALETATSHEELTNILYEGMTGVIPSWKVHSETGKEYGILFTKIDRHGNEHTWSGSQLDRALSYGQVEAALARNLAARQAQEEASRIAEQQELARQQQEVQRKAEEDKARDMIAGRNSIIYPMSHGEVSMVSVRKNAYQLMKAVTDAGITVNKETTAKFNELKDTWNELYSLDHEARTTKDAAERTKYIGGMLMRLNPILGLTVMFLAKISSDIRQAEIKAQKKQLLAKVESIRSEISQLQEKKAQLKIEKQERLQEYLDAKQMFKEYMDGLQALDRNIKMIKEDIQKNDRVEEIRNFTKSESAQILLNQINGAFGNFEGHEHLISGPLVITETGMRWELYSDGYTDGKDIYHPHEPAPVKYGKSYVDFSYNEQGHLIATIEADKNNDYTKGVSGSFDLSTGDGDVKERTYYGAKEEHDVKTPQATKDNSADVRKSRQLGNRNGMKGPTI